MNLDTVTHVLKEVQIPEPKIREVEAKLKALAREEKEEREAKGKTKNQFVIMLSDKDGILPDDLAGWVTQIPLDDDAGLVIEKIKQGVKTYNATSRKGRKYPIKSIGEAMETLGPKVLKPLRIRIKTRGLTRVLRTDNTIG